MLQNFRFSSWRRTFACALVGLSSLLGVTNSIASDFPSRPIKIVVAFGPGGMNDLTARELARRVQSKLGQPVVIENKPGAGQIAAMQAVAGSPADGYTLLFGSVTGFSLTPHLFKNIPVNPSKFIPVVPISVTPTVLVTMPDFPANSLTDLVKYAKGRSTGLNYASTGVGASAHIAMAVYAKATGINANHIPYKGDITALTAVRSREVDVAALSLFAALPRIKSGELKAIGIFQDLPARSLPKVQIPSQAGVPDASIPSWIGLFAPPNTPTDVVHKLETATRAVISLPEFQQFLTERGSEPLDMDNKGFSEYISRISTRAGKAIRNLNLQPNE
ncbi:tripartite tricarboxylate transporter substrate binding protein [Cupriavidus necator]|uniref:Tripartite tricarboxylate transporter substrate binding protein n=1 Tax=Cupriavidus necator TaxID=106590 RepID=A0A367PG13_CUPNE|nr:tripartite tricarboxylate transporter substrate binding protein [Cupriavidus necator]QQX86636.1 tripartite tricarboxylate transporter substrate binding protein [Cupriavidus necator]RCJ06831.1 tripartite tricarboxylate transporter substrate binding protein [Cupriavidus necator]